MAYNAPVGSVTNGVNAPATFADMGVEAALKLKALNKKLDMESLQDDIFEQLGTDVAVKGNEMAVPNAIFLKLDAVPTGARTVTIPMLMALRGSPTVGAGTPLGNEQTQALKYATFYYGEYSYAVASTAWGATYNDMAVYGVFEKIQPQISTYMKEFRGRRIREALLRTFDSVLTDANGAGIDDAWNKNWFIANTAVGDQPVFDNDTSSFTGVIGTAIDTAIGTNPSDAYIDLNYLLSLEYYAANYLRIDPIMIGGKESYIVLVPTIQGQLLKRNSDGQLGEVYTDMVRKTADVMEYTGALGRVGKLVLVEDTRYPELTATTTAITTRFLYPGNEEERTFTPATATVNSCDVGFLLGKAALCEWTVRGLHFETETQNYGYNKGTGVFGESGIGTVQYDVEDGWNTTPSSPTTRENTSSVVLVWATPGITS